MNPPDDQEVAAQRDARDLRHLVEIFQQIGNTAAELRAVLLCSPTPAMVDDLPNDDAPLHTVAVAAAQWLVRRGDVTSLFLEFLHRWTTALNGGDGMDALEALTSGVPRVQPPARAFQTRVFEFLDDLGVASATDIECFGDHEIDVFLRDFFDRSIGRGIPLRGLLRIECMNLRFAGQHLALEDSTLLDVVHRKTAVYGDHAVLVTEALQIDARAGAHDVRARLDAMLRLFLRHRALIESGKMSIVPEQVVARDAQAQTRSLFRADELVTTRVDMRNPEVATFFLQGTSLLDPVGTLVVDLPGTCGLHLLDILEIEASFPLEYQRFQTLLRSALVGVNPEDTARALARALQEVEQAVLELDIQFETRRRARTRTAQPGEGNLVLRFFGDRLDAAYLADAARTSATGIRFIPPGERFPDEFRKNPYFVPWVIRRAALRTTRTS